MQVFKQVQTNMWCCQSYLHIQFWLVLHEVRLGLDIEHKGELAENNDTGLERKQVSFWKLQQLQPEIFKGQVQVKWIAIDSLASFPGPNRGPGNEAIDDKRQLQNDSQ